MPTSLCLRCLRRSLCSAEAPISALPISCASFSTSNSVSATAQGKRVVVAPKKGKSLSLAKRKRENTARSPAAGERKALRKRIVLSNTNAIEVRDLQELTGDKLVRHEAGTVALEGFGGQVLAFNNETVDALRALEAFKPTQGCSLFRRPASLVRAPTVGLANDIATAGGEAKETIRKVIFGERGSGKSVLVLQAQAMAFLNGWVVVHFPDAQELTIGHTSYQPVNSSNGTLYTQSHYTAKLLENIARANHALLSTLRISKQHQLPIPIQSNISLARFAEFGARDPELAWPIWQALWSELTSSSPSGNDKGLSRPPVFVSMDGVDQAMRVSAYLDREANPVHAHDLALVRHFMDMLSGQIRLPNGGMVLAATCQSNRAFSPTLDHCLKHAYTTQYNLLQEGDGPAGDSSALPLPTWDPYALKDARVESVMQGVPVIKLQGLTKDEARGVMEYYARSGMFRGAITEDLVNEKWTLAGSGIIGELEKAAVRVRF